MNNKQKLRHRGYCLINNVFTEQEILALRSDSLTYFKTGAGIANAGGVAKPNWIGDSACANMLWLLDHKILKTTLEDYIGSKYVFLDHNDIHLNRVVGWHKDNLSGAGKKHEVHSPWSTINGVRQEIYKVNIYLQDHTNNEHALAVVPNSHTTSEMRLTDAIVNINPNIGDIVLFDQRITHRGQQHHQNTDRLLISLGYGIPSVFTEQFKLGTNARQDDQNRVK